MANVGRPVSPVVLRVVVGLWLVLMTVLCAAITTHAAGDVGPARVASEGRGTAGVYVVTDRVCGKSCDDTGDFTPAGASTPTLSGVPIAGGGAPQKGTRVAAVVVAGSVYGVGGSAYRTDLMQLVLGPLGLVLIGWLAVWRPLRRHRGWLWENVWGPAPARHARHRQAR